jgi:hypothetical protein
MQSIVSWARSFKAFLRHWLGKKSRPTAREGISGGLGYGWRVQVKRG